MKDVSGMTVLVTGAAMGLGRLFAERAVAEGAAAVVLLDVDTEALAQAAEELSGRGTRVLAEEVDVRRLPAIRAAARRIHAEVGPVDVLVNNAGVVRGNDYFWETRPEDTKFTLDVNTLAPMQMAHVFLPEMIAPGTDGTVRERRLVNIASAAGLTSNPRMAAYAASKWAVVGWSDSVRLELEQAGHHHVKVTTVCPYYVRTGMFDGARSAPLLPLLEPGDVVDQTWSAMLRGQAMLVMPRTVLISEVAKGVLPIGVRDFVADKVLGIYHTMDEFTGRQE